NVHRAWDPRHLSLDFTGELIVGRAAVAGHFDVDGGGQAEVQDLADDVRRLPEEVAGREAAPEPLPEPLDVLFRGPVPCPLEGDQDLPVRGPCGRAVSVG